MDLMWLKHPAWDRRGAPLHGFLGRRGGKSAGVYGGLNLSFRVGDDPALVKDNFCDVKKAVGVHNLKVVTMKQVHGDHIADVADANVKEIGEADGMVAERPGIFLGVLTADCTPILFAVPELKLAAVVHAGWRGTLAGIAPKMVRHLHDRYDVASERIEAALGPTIGPCCYEIGADVADPLLEKWGDAATHSIFARGGRQFLDIRELNRRQLETAGVTPERIAVVAPCTSCDKDFFSYRRDKETGRQLSFIGWAP
jgi:purine-nucleoside/S-methyl-5'-thioadenosine phosphorylase / adenosine deaminase